MFGRNIALMIAPDMDPPVENQSDGPTFIELRARGSSRAEEADFLAVVGWMLAKAGFESQASDMHPPAREVILPAGWRDLPIVKVSRSKCASDG